MKRLDRLFVDLLGTPDDAYHREVARLMLVAGVARIFEPGCKFDYACILEGPEGLRKSSFIRTLAARPQWFGELHGDFRDRKELVEQMQGVWPVEMPELTGFTKATVLKVKAFMSSQDDKVRLAYEARSVPFPRQCILMGTTNDRTYLQSDTGERRFWPILVRILINTGKLAEIVDQLWAEAVVEYRKMRAEKPLAAGGLKLQSDEAKRLALHYQGSRKVETLSDIIAGQIEALVDKPMSLFEINGDAGSKLDDGKYVISKVGSLWLHEKLGEGRPMPDPKVYTVAMRKLKGWVESENALDFGHHGRQRGFKREGATLKELREGYMRQDRT